MNRCVLDTNVFIDAYKRYYRFDLVPSFWRTLLNLAESGSVISIDRVKEEIVRGGKDELTNWITSEFDGWFMSTDEERVFDSYRQIIDWVQEQDQYKDYAKAEFASVADSWLIAYAKGYHCTVVTHEKFNPDSKKKVPIPNVCAAFGVSCMDPFEMLRRFNVRLG